MSGRLLFNFSAVAEALVGVALLIAPADVIELLLGGGTSQTGSSVGRVLEIGLISLGVSVFGTARQKTYHTTRAGNCTYNLGAGVLLSILGAGGEQRNPSLARCRVTRIDWCDDALGYASSD